MPLTSSAAPHPTQDYVKHTHTTSPTTSSTFSSSIMNFVDFLRFANNYQHGDYKINRTQFHKSNLSGGEAVRYVGNAIHPSRPRKQVHLDLGQLDLRHNKAHTLARRPLSLPRHLPSLLPTQHCYNVVTSVIYGSGTPPAAARQGSVHGLLY